MRTLPRKPRAHDRTTYAYLDEQTKRMIRRAMLKAAGDPGLPGAVRSREMPMPYGWGTGGVQVIGRGADADEDRF